MTATCLCALVALLVLACAQDPLQPEIRAENGNLVLSISANNQPLVERRLYDSSNSTIVAVSTDVLLSATQIDSRLAPILSSLASQGQLIAGLRADLLTERSRAVVAETALSASIAAANMSLNAEKSMSALSEQSLAASVDLEESRAMTAESALSAGVGAVSAGLSSEISRATAAEALIGLGLGSEISRGLVVESQLSIAIGTQISRATNTEAVRVVYVFVVVRFSPKTSRSLLP
jgi:hypothetical protein